MERRYLKTEAINQTGCMWMFITIFGSNHNRLLLDKKRGSKRLAGGSSSSCCESSVEIMRKKDIVEPEVLDDESEEKFSEFIKRLIAHKEGEIQTCKDLLEAFHAKKDSKRVVVVEEEEEEGDSKQEEVVVVPKKKKRNFFSRKWRSGERSEAKTIVVLKPGPKSLDVESSGNKSKTGGVFSRFLTGLIKRRLQSDVGEKSSCDVPKSHNSCVQEEEIQSKSEKHTDDHASEDSKKIMSGLYIAAKKHLSEMLANGDIDKNVPDKEEARILGKILSLPEFSSPSQSPRLVPGHDSVNTEEPEIPQCSSGTNDLIDEDLDEDDVTLFTVDVSDLRDHEVETEDVVKEETCSSSVSEQVEYVDEDKLDFCEEDRDKESSEKEMINQEHSSPTESPPSSPVRLAERKEIATDVHGEFSPVSVLEPLFTDDDNSPTASSRFSSAEMRIQPLCIRFDEADSPKPDKDNNVKTTMDDKELILAYIEAVVKTSSLSWDELLTRPFYSEHILETELTDDIVFYSTQFCDDEKLLYDCINEVLLDFCENELNPGPCISFVKPELQLISDVEIAVKVAQEGVYWHLLPLPSPHTLDQIVKKDMAKTGSWMDLRFDIGCIGSGTSEMILDDLVEEIVRSYRDIVQAEPMQDQNNNNNNL